jgi:hypothetical protein
MPDDRSRIVVIERNCKDYSKKPMMGIWIYARDFKKKDTQNLNLEKLHLVWALITDYIVWRTSWYADSLHSWEEKANGFHFLVYSINNVKSMGAFPV